MLHKIPMDRKRLMFKLAIPRCLGIDDQALIEV